MSNTLRYESEASEIYAKLKLIPRTGWAMRGVSNPETVYDHTVSLVLLAKSMASEITLSDSELDDLTHILEIHDWAEAIVGDEYVPNENRKQYAEHKQLKAVRERVALKELISNKDYRDEVLALFDRYENNTDPIASLAKQIDKYQALELALIYEQEQGVLLFDEFYEYYKRDWPFSHPAKLKRIDTLCEIHHTL